MGYGSKSLAKPSETSESQLATRIVEASGANATSTKELKPWSCWAEATTVFIGGNLSNPNPGEEEGSRPSPSVLDLSRRLDFLSSSSYETELTFRTRIILGMAFPNNTVDSLETLRNLL